MRASAVFALGIILGLAMGAWIGGATRAEFFVRAAVGGRYLLDARLDESVIGRALNIPAATLGEATVTKRSWILLTRYHFTLRLRPDLAGGAQGAIRSLEVSARLPGRITSTNAARVAGGTAVWEVPPPHALVLRTRTVHWIRIVVLGALGGAVVAAYRRR